MTVPTDLPVTEGSPLDLANFVTSGEDAAINGLEILIAGPQELFLDIDDGLDAFHRRLERFRQIFGVGRIERWPSKSEAAGHWHVRITMLRDYTVQERVALQACLGSDPMKEMLTIGRELYTVQGGEHVGKTVRLFRVPGVEVQHWNGAEWQMAPVNIRTAKSFDGGPDVAVFDGEDAREEKFNAMIDRAFNDDMRKL